MGDEMVHKDFENAYWNQTPLKRRMADSEAHTMQLWRSTLGFDPHNSSNDELVLEVRRFYCLTAVYCGFQAADARLARLLRDLGKR